MASKLSFAYLLTALIFLSACTGGSGNGAGGGDLSSTPLTPVSTVAELSLSNPVMPTGVIINTNSDITLVLSNIGLSPATQVSFNSLNAPFSVLSNNCAAQISSGGSCQIVVRYAPTVYNVAADTATLSVSYSGGDTTSVTRNLTGQSEQDVGAFTISGITGTADAVNDAYLNGGLTASINWGASSNASSYDVVIYENDGTTVKCALVNETLQTHDFAACNLTAGSSYKASVTAKSAASSRAASNSPYSFRVNQAPVANADTLTMMYDGAALSVNPRANDTDADSDTLTISAKTNGTYGTVAIDAGSSTLTYTPNGTTYGSDSFTYTISDGAGATATATVTVKLMTIYTWIGSGANTDWGTNGNWCGSIASPGLSGACAGGSGPTSNSTVSHVAVFNSLCGANRNVSLGANAAAYKIEMQSSYAGTFTQTAGFTISVGAGGWSMSGGTFSGSSTNTAANNISIVGLLNLTGGTFTSTRAKLTLAPTLNTGSVDIFTMSGAASFSHNSGTFESTFPAQGCGTAATYNFTPLNGTTFYDLTANGGGGCGSAIFNLATGVVVNVTHTLTQGPSYVSFTGGEINLTGDLVQSSVGNSSDMTIRFSGAMAQTYTGSNAGSAGYDVGNIIIDKTGGSVTPANNNAFYASTFTLLQGSFKAPTSALYVGTRLTGNKTIFKVTAGTTFDDSGAALFLGAALASCTPYTYQIDVPNNFTWNGNATISNISGGCGGVPTMDLINGSNFIIKGNLETGNVALKGNWSIEGDFLQTYLNAGTAALTFSGVNPKTYTYVAGAFPTGDIVINKPGTTLTLATNWTANGAGQDLLVSAGTLDMNGKNLTVAGVCTIAVGATLTRNLGTLTCTGGIVNNGSLNP